MSTVYRGVCLTCRVSRTVLTRTGTTLVTKDGPFPTCYTLGLASADQDEGGRFIEEHAPHDLRIIHEDDDREDYWMNGVEE